MSDPAISAAAAPAFALHFIIGGVQKGGTTALARYLSGHPGLRLPAVKEAHVFDAPDLPEAADRAELGRRFAAHFPPDPGPPRLCGDATPITVFHPVLIARAARYAPALRWIVLLRDPVERAISHYHMNRRRGSEPLSMWAAFRAEGARLAADRDPWRIGSALREHSYIARGRYAGQISALYHHFPREQVLLLRSRDLRCAPRSTCERALRFLGLDPALLPGPFEPEFEGDYLHPSPLAPALLYLRWCLRGEVALLRRRCGIDLRAP